MIREDAASLTGPPAVSAGKLSTKSFSGTPPAHTHVALLMIVVSSQLLGD